MPQYPRGAAGCVLHPGTTVEVCGLRSAGHLNGTVGTVKVLNESNGRLHVAFADGSIKAFKPGNLRKITPKQDDDPELDRVMAIFGKFDTNGDGIMDNTEFAACLKALGLSGALLQTFLEAVDKDGDGEVQYAEFARWALSKPTGRKMNRLDTLSKNLGDSLKKDIADAAEKADASDEDVADGRELTLEDIEALCRTGLPDDWPDHGLTVVNNVHARFPDYPVEGIIWQMKQNEYVGGKVVHAIRKMGEREVDCAPAQGSKVNVDGAFPAWYKVRSLNGSLPVYEEAGRNWSLSNMRDGKLKAVGSIPQNARFRVNEVRRGNEYGFCFGKIDFEGRKHPPHWVVLGMDLDTDGAKGFRKRQASIEELNYTEAARDE
eukprot:TRINITY_DN31046_c0_g1_i1.p1 TRINITY_DN31046_c0_g1~~TRINITY_DN31046_c0_g1_i1.p1  ORF type:complete len:393 (-),score=69.97 TRINITY_DN31046_c0_g1_i1:9-1136(-)